MMQSSTFMRNLADALQQRIRHVLYLVILLMSAGPAAGFEWAPQQSVGTVMPVFSLSNDQNEKIRLSELYGHEGTLLVFYRSADW